MQFIVTAGEGNRLILHAQTSRTYELICAVENEDSLFSALKRFCGKFRSKLQMEEFLRDYQSDSTRQGITFKEYNRQLKEQWETFFAPVYKGKIESAVNESFPVVIPTFMKKKRFKVKLKL